MVEGIINKEKLNYLELGVQSRVSSSITSWNPNNLKLMIFLEKKLIIIVLLRELLEVIINFSL